jgi:phage tail-like protein
LKTAVSYRYDLAGVMMTDSTSPIWPKPTFYFTADFGNGLTANFQEVSGLDSETKPIEYRHGNDPVFYPIEMPGIGRVGNVTMHRGIFVNNSNFQDLNNQVKLKTVKPGIIVMKLLDEAGATKMTWTLNNARPIKVIGPDLKSDGNEIAVDAIEIAYETLVITTP